MVIVMNEKYCKCLMPYRAIYCDCAYVDLSDSRKEYCDLCGSQMNFRIT